MKDYVEFSRSKTHGDVIDGISALLKIKTAVGDHAIMVKLAEAKLLDDKNQDYGPNNITEIGILGICSRIRDKLARVENIVKKQQEQTGVAIINESLEDAAMDIANYGTILHLVLKDLWH